MWEIISGVLGILGFVLSFINLVVIIFSRRKKVTANFEKCKSRYRYFNGNMMMIKYRFDNHSELPVSITRIRFYVDKTYYDVYPHPLRVAESKYNNGKAYYRNVEESTTLPISLAPLGSVGGYLFFRVPLNMIPTDERPLTFQICTNRGKAIQKTFAPHEDILCR